MTQGKLSPCAFDASWHRSCTLWGMNRNATAQAVFRRLGLGLAALLGPGSVSAAPDPGTATHAVSSAGVELIAFEAPGCIYCPVFRRDVAPTYAASRAGKTAPLRFVDINDAAADSFKLTSPVTIVPTLILVRDGVEIGRIAGYVGRENMHRILNALLPVE